MVFDLGLSKNVFVEDIVDSAFQEIDILFGTENTELIGEPYYGTNFEKFLWELTPNEESLKRYIENKISTETFFMKMLNYEVDVNTKDDDNEKVYVVTIYIYRNDKIYNRKIITIK